MNRRHLLAAAAAAGVSTFGGGRAASGAAPLRVGAALPDPPFELMGASGPEGFDIELMKLIAALDAAGIELIGEGGVSQGGGRGVRLKTAVASPEANPSSANSSSAKTRPPKKRER